jgi:hypothetical protein
MSYLDFPEIKEELVVFLRNSDVLSTTVRGVTTDTDDTFDGDASTVNFDIARANVKNIRTISVDAVVQVLGTDYTVDYAYSSSATRITFTSAPASGTGNITLSYDYGTDKIYPDYPRDDIKVSSYPRIAVGVLGSGSEEVALGGSVISTSVSISVSVYDDSEKNIDAIMKLVRDAFLGGKKSFFTLRFVTPVGTSPMIPSPGRGNKISSRTMDLIAPLNIEE